MSNLKDTDFRVGTKFVGNIDGTEMEIVQIKDDYTNRSKIVTYKNLKTGRLHNYGLKALTKCDVTILRY